MKYLCVKSLLILLIVSCTTQSNKKIIHPTQHNINGEHISSHINIENNSSFNNTPGLDSFVSSLENMHKDISIGKHYGKEEQMFGRIQDVVMDSNNRIYILDFSNQHIRVFDKNGEYINTLGRKGEGPGEFERARSITIYKNKLLIVSNGYRIETFDISKQEIKFHKTFQFKKPFRSICTIGDQLFAHHEIIFDDKNKDNISTLNNIQTFLLPSFKPVHSFGQTYKSDNISAVERLSNGEISCNKNSQTITFIFKRVPIILGFNSTDGKLKWGTQIKNIKLPKIKQSTTNGRPSLTYKIPKGGVRDNIFRVVNAKNHFEMIQILRRVMSENNLDYDTKIITLMVNTYNGKANVSSKKLPLIMNIPNETNVFTVSNDFTKTELNTILQ